MFVSVRKLKDHPHAGNGMFKRNGYRIIEGVRVGPTQEFELADSDFYTILTTNNYDYWTSETASVVLEYHRRGANVGKLLITLAYFVT
jgi:hypothetical protein